MFIINSIGNCQIKCGHVNSSLGWIGEHVNWSKENELSFMIGMGKEEEMNLEDNS